LTIGEAAALAYVAVFGGMWLVFRVGVWLGYFEE